MSVRLALLGLLRDRPSHGYDLKCRYDELISPDRPIQPAQVYSTLGRLERDGRVALAGVDQGGGPERRTYALTPAGERELKRWLADPAEPEPHLRNVLHTKVVLAVLAGESVTELLDTQRAAYLDRMRELTTLQRTGDASVALLADYALVHVEADLRWLELAAARLDDVTAWIAGGRGSSIRPTPSPPPHY